MSQIDFAGVRDKKKVIYVNDRSSGFDPVDCIHTKTHVPNLKSFWKKKKKKKEMTKYL